MTHPLSGFPPALVRRLVVKVGSALLDAVLPMLDEPVEGKEEDAPEAEKPWSPI